MPAGAPLGNNNAGKAKLWTAAITRALEKRTRKEGVEALEVLAEKLLDACEEGELSALKEFGDRIEGKPHQSMTHEGSEMTVNITSKDAGLLK